MTVSAVHWHEGMFLSPQHFQVSDRFIALQHQRSAQFNQPQYWGLRELQIDHDALANFRFSVLSLQARLRDGTQLAVPADGTLADLDLKQSLAAENYLTVSLAVPKAQHARPNAAEAGASQATRFMVNTLDVEDENTGQNAQPVKVRHLNLKLLHSGQDPAGYETLPIARIRRADRAEAVPALDESYIPPLLACGAWKPLQTNILQRIYDRFGRKCELLSSQLVSRGITHDSQGQGDRLLLEQLRVTNECYAPLSMTAFTPGMHPATAYLELLRAVGKLALLGPTRRVPELPRYDHDDLGTCFWRLKQQVDALLDAVVEPEYKERPFIGAGLRMQVDLEPSWLEGDSQIFVGVHSSLPAGECDALLTGGLDMKLSSSDRVGEVYRLGLAGLRFAHASHPPRALPAKGGLTYFKIDRGAQPEQWDAVKGSLTLALRLNENLIVSDIEGQRTLTIKNAGKTFTMQFTLYVIPHHNHPATPDYS